MAEFVQITTTTADRSDAERIAAQLVERRLAGCVQIVGPIQSLYRWKAAVESSEEWLAIVKTRHDQVAAIEKLLAQIHPYEVPELIVTPIVGGGASYLEWLGAQIGPEPDGG